MMRLEQAADIARRAMKYSSADECEILLAGGNSSLTRFANNTIHQNVSEQNHFVSVRTVFSGKTARATTNKLDETSLQRAIKNAEALSKVQHPDADLLPMPSASEASEAASPQRHFPETAALGP